MQEFESIKSKIHQYFNGRLNSQHEKELVDWINEDYRNREFFRKQKHSLSPSDIDHPLVESSWHELKNKIFIQQQFLSKEKKVTRSIFHRIGRIAALALVVVGLSFLMSRILVNIPYFDTAVVWFETTAPRGEKARIQLPDGSRVWLNSETKISYPSNFSDGNRKVKLSGEAYFEVEKQKGALFHVETRDYIVEVLGTRFNVMAYSDFNRTETTLLEGKVKIIKGKKELNVVPGQKAVFRGNQFYVDETGTETAKYWTEDRFAFDGVSFEELVKRLGRWYNVDISITSENLKQVTYSGIFKNEETIIEVLNSVQVLIPFEYTRIDERKFEIRNK